MDSRNILAKIGEGRVRYTFHSLRHGASTNSLLSGVPISRLKTSGHWGRIRTSCATSMREKFCLLTRRFHPASKEASRSWQTYGLITVRGGRRRSNLFYLASLLFSFVFAACPVNKHAISSLLNLPSPVPVVWI